MHERTINWIVTHNNFEQMRENKIFFFFFHDNKEILAEKQFIAYNSIDNHYCLKKRRSKLISNGQCVFYFFS